MNLLSIATNQFILAMALVVSVMAIAIVIGLRGGAVPPAAAPAAHQALAPLGVTVAVEHRVAMDQPAPVETASALGLSDPLPAVPVSEAVAEAHASLPEEAEQLAAGASGAVAAAEAEPLREEPLLLPTVTLQQALLTAEVRAFAFTGTATPSDAGESEISQSPVSEPPASPPSEMNCNYEGSRPPVNPPRIARPDGTVIIPAYAEYQDSLGRSWIWDGRAWIEKSPTSATAVNAC